ncbi:glycosyltransferase [Caldimonas tepidiphila]|uniref:glycosyltransferase n=1 Tax=Caldimonas tepidiphila TaxID=2315841 RepID=UPI000E5B0681|nr:glycosyltransferase [Caldimonas tepidiphila]
MKRLLVFRSGLLPPSETFIREQALALRQWRPLLLGLERLDDGLPLDGLEWRCVDPPQLKSWKRRLASRLLRLGAPQRRFLNELRASGARLLHVHFGVDAVKFWPVARALRLPVLVTLHGYDIQIHPQWWEDGHGGDAMRDYPARLRAMARSDRVRFLAVSEAIRERALEWGLPAHKLQVSYIGVDTRRFAPGGQPVAQRPPRLLFVGRLVEKKGCEVLIRALAQLRARVPQAELAVIGDGPLRPALEQLAAALCPGGVHFLGRQPPQRVRAELDLARVFCLPSLRAASGDAEGLGIVILEAQACGVPVLTSACGGAREAIEHGVSGLRHAEGDVQGLAEGLLRLLQDDALADAFSRAARQRMVERFDLADCSRRLERIYDEVAEASSRPPRGLGRLEAGLR